MAKLNVPYRYIQGLPKSAQQEIFRNFEEVAKVLASIGGGQFEAIINPDLTSDTPKQGLFTTVRAALVYYSGLGYSAGQTLTFLMTGREVTPFGTTKAVTEVANITSAMFPPGGLKIIGKGGVTWNLAGQTVTATGNECTLMLQDVFVLCNGSVTPLVGMNIIHIDGGGFSGPTASPLCDSSTGNVFVDNAYFQGAIPGASINGWYTNCFFTNVSNSTQNVSTQGTLGLYNCHIDGATGGLSKWNIAATRACIIDCEGAATATASDAIHALSFTGGTTQSVFVTSGGRGGNGATNRQSALSLDMNGQTKASIVIEGGTYHDVVTSGTTPSSPDAGMCIVHCTAKSAVSIIGPADIAISSRYLTAGGSRVVGSAHLTCSGNGTAFTGVSLTDSNIDIVVGPGGTPANCRAINLDAGCARNIIGYSGHASFGLANIDLGTSDLLWTYTGMSGAPSGPAGGDLTGTYPNPTLSAIIGAGGPTGDATHVPVVTWDAKGRLTAVSSILITGVVPATHASTHARGGTDPIDGVFKDFTESFLMMGAS